MKFATPCLGLVLFFCLYPGASPGEEDLFARGKEVFANFCADCHRANGEGLPDTFPALNKNSFVVGNPRAVILTVLNGRKGKLGRMPAWRDSLSDAEIAAAVTYIRHAWDNKAPGVTVAMVKSLKEKKP